MADNYRRNRRTSGIRHKKRRRFGCFPTLLVFIVAAIAIMYAVSVFFTIKNIDIKGTAIYTAEEVRRASGIGEDANLLFVNKVSITTRIFSELPYAKEVRITRNLPDTLVIDITERDRVAYFKHNEKLWLVDETGHVLEGRNTAAGIEDEQLIEISGVDLLYPSVGDVFYLPEAQKEAKDSIINMLKSIKDKGMEKEIRNIHISDSFEAKINYMGRFMVILPLSSDYDVKLNNLKLVIEQLEDNEMGIINMMSEDQIRFIRHTGNGPVWRSIDKADEDPLSDQDENASGDNEADNTPDEMQHE